MKFEEIYTERLILRKLTQECFDYIHSEMTQEDQLKILGLESNKELLKEKEKYKNGLSSHNKKFLYYQLIDKKAKEIIGWCGFHTWYTDHNRAEIGYGLFRDDYKNKGLMSEAISPIIDYGFMQMKLNRIEAFIEPENIASIKLIKKLNFVKEGQLREHYYNYKNDRIEDSMVYSLLRREYEKK